MLLALLLFYFASMIGLYIFGVWYLYNEGSATVRELIQLFIAGLVPIFNFWVLYIGIAEVIEDSGILDREVF